MRATRAWAILIVLQGLILAGQWLGGPTIATPAQAQALDPGRDRMVMIDELQGINSKLDQLIAILERGDLQVRAVLPDEPKARGPAR